MENFKEKKDLQNFLKKVDDVDSIIRGLVSSDLDVQATAISRADKELASVNSTKKSSSTEIVFDRTSINRDAYKSDENVGPNFTKQHTSQEAFLTSLEADSQKRAKARKERHQKANMIKEQGNDSFNKGMFEEAIQFYSEAMKIAKDLTTLYTNRAAAYLKLQEFQRAVDDCEFALRIDDSWIKAYILKAKCLTKLHKFDDALQQYNKVKEIDKDKVGMVEKCISILEKERKQYSLEEQIAVKLEKEELQSVNFARLIQFIKDKSEMNTAQAKDTLMYFTGGFQVLQGHMVDEESKTMFRTKGGFQMFSGPGIISQSIRAKFNNKQTYLHSAELVASFLSLCTAACSKMAENANALLVELDMPELLLSFFEWPEECVKQSIILFFNEMSTSVATRSVLYGKTDCLKLSSFLIKPDITKAGSTLNAATALCNFASDSKYCRQIHKCFSDDFTIMLAECLSQVGKLNNESLKFRLSYIVKLLENIELCKCIGKDDSFRKNCVNSLENCSVAFKNGVLNSVMMSKLLHILRSILKIKNDEDNCQNTVTFLRPVLLKTKDDDLLLGILQVVSLVLELQKNCIECLFSSFSHAIVKVLFNCLKKDVSVKTFALKILCCAGQLNANYIHSYIKLDKNYEILRNILSSDDSAEEINQGHVALFLAALSTKPKGLEPILSINVEGEIVRKLLVLCRDCKNKQVCSNCAISLGKLAVCDEKFLIELRKHDGINILSRLKTKDVLC